MHPTPPFAFITKHSCSARNLIRLFGNRRFYSSSLTSIVVFFHLRAGMWRLNMMSISR